MLWRPPWTSTSFFPFSDRPTDPNSLRFTQRDSDLCLRRHLGIKRDPAGAPCSADRPDAPGHKRRSHQCGGEVCLGVGHFTHQVCLLSDFNAIDSKKTYLCRSTKAIFFVCATYFTMKTSFSLLSIPGQVVPQHRRVIGRTPTRRHQWCVRLSCQKTVYYSIV